jgi:hypothetical protein
MVQPSKIALIIIINTIVSCVPHGVKNNAEVNTNTHYSELDVLNLNGINILKDTAKYPFVTVNKIDSTHKRIDCWYSVNQHSQETYEYESLEKDWLNQSSFISDTGKVLVIKKVFIDRIVYLEYEDQAPQIKLLGTVRIFKNNVITSYYFKKSINVKIGSFDEEYLNSPLREIVKDSTHLEGDNIMVYLITNNKIQNFCYHIGPHDLNWWYTYQNFLDWNKIACNKKG